MNIYIIKVSIYCIMNELDKMLSPELSNKLNIIKELGFNLSPESVIMDFGCGSGKMVKELRDLGYQAFGCGTRFITTEGVDTETMMKEGIIRTIDFHAYRLPFEDNSIDFVFSHSVFEHVQNYSESISEIARVLKPNGFSLHFFPSRYRPIESHIFVPLASIIQSHSWLHFWTLLGVRNEYSYSLNARETSDMFYNYLKTETNYLSKRQLKENFGMHFKNVIFCENLSIKHSERRGKYLYLASKYLTFINTIYSAARTRAIFTSMPIKH
jgi:ubiquinone/menaquinone biosynthesis C-methylase UbiE